MNHVLSVLGRRALLALAISSSAGAVWLGCGGSSGGGGGAAPAPAACTTGNPSCPSRTVNIQPGCPFYMTYSPPFATSRFVYNQAGGTVPPGLTFDTLQGTANVARIQGMVSNSIVVGTTFMLNVQTIPDTGQPCTGTITFQAVAGPPGTACMFPAGSAPQAVQRALTPTCDPGQTATVLPNMLGGAPGTWAAVGTLPMGSSVDPLTGATSLPIGQANVTAQVQVRDQASGAPGGTQTIGVTSTGGGGGGGGGASPYAGTWQGTFTFTATDAQGQPVTGAAAQPLNVRMTFQTLTPPVNGVETLTVSSVTIDEQNLPAVNGAIPTLGIATFPSPIGGPSPAGAGIVINFGNGTSFATANGANALIVNAAGTQMGHNPATVGTQAALAWTLLTNVGDANTPGSGPRGNIYNRTVFTGWTLNKVP